MSGDRRFRITTPTLAIMTCDHGQQRVVVPANEIVTISESPSPADSLIDIVWNDKNYRMFSQDLRDRSVPSE